MTDNDLVIEKTTRAASAVETNDYGDIVINGINIGYYMADFDKRGKEAEVSLDEVVRVAHDAYWGATIFVDPRDQSGVYILKRDKLKYVCQPPVIKAL